MIFFFLGLKYYQFFFRFQLHNSKHSRSNLKRKRKYKYKFLKIKKTKKKKHSKRIDSLCSSNVRRIDSQWHQREQNQLWVFYKDMKIDSLMSTKFPKSIFMTKS